MFFDDKNEKARNALGINSDTFAGDIQIERLPPMRQDILPLTDDDIEMFYRFPAGVSLGTNVVAMLLHNPDEEPARYITLIHKPTGERIRITFPYEEE